MVWYEVNTRPVLFDTAEVQVAVGDAHDRGWFPILWKLPRTQVPLDDRGSALETALEYYVSRRSWESSRSELKVGGRNDM